MAKDKITKRKHISDDINAFMKKAKYDPSKAHERLLAAAKKKQI